MARALQIIYAEVISMSADPIWKAFAESGDPLYYMLYKAVSMGVPPDGKSRDAKTGGQPPQTQG